MSVSQFDLLSTTRRDPQLLQLPWNTKVNSGSTSPYLLLSYHHDRLRDAAEHHDWPIPESFSVSALEDLCETALKDERARSEDPTHREHYRVAMSFTCPAPRMLIICRFVSCCRAPARFP